MENSFAKWADWRLLVFAIATPAMLGCGPSVGAPVEGVVTLDGVPLENAKVTLMRGDGPKENRFFLGQTDATGRYAMQNASTLSPGVAPGKYQLRITSIVVPAGADETTKLPRERVPPAYQSGKMTIEVPPEGKMDADFEIASRSRR